MIAHVYYPEVWPDIEDRLARLPEANDPAVTSVCGPAESLEREIVRRFPRKRRSTSASNHGLYLASVLELGSTLASSRATT